MKDPHCSEPQLEAFLRMPDTLTAKQKQEIRSHIERCKLCAEHLKTLEEYYSDLETRLRQPATDRDYAFAASLMFQESNRLPPSRSLVKKRSESLLENAGVAIEPYRRPLPQRVFRYLILHPVKAAGTATISAMILTAAFFLLHPSKDLNPTFAQIENNVLSVYNKHGEVLWKKSVFGLPDVTSAIRLIGEKKRFVLVDDLDGDDQNEVLLTGTSSSPSVAADTLYCFNSNGKLRWKRGVGQVIIFGKMTFTAHSNWKIADFFVFTNDDSEKSHLFVLVRADPYFSTKLFEIDPRDGSELQSYWHAGYLNTWLLHDIDLDGKKEILLGGMNNAYRRACLAVLDPSNIQGYGPMTPDFAPKKIPKAPEKYYLLFPATELTEILGRFPYNHVNALILNNDGTIIVRTGELTEHMGGEGILYTVFPGMKVKVAVGSDTYIKVYEQLEEEGKVHEPLTPSYWEKLKNSVLYWDGEKFVNQPTGNAEYFKRQTVP